MTTSSLPFDNQTIADLLLRIYEIHERIIARTGGIEGLRDGAMLHSAVARPFVTFDGIDLYLNDFDKAAALFHSLIKSHPFMDGTKRTAFASAIFFLEQLGYQRPAQFPIDEVIQFCLAIAEENQRLAAGQPIRAKSIQEISIWLKELYNR